MTLPRDTIYITNALPQVVIDVAGYSLLFMPDCCIPLKGRGLLTQLGPTLFLDGQENHPHHLMILTEGGKEEILKLK